MKKIQKAIVSAGLLLSVVMPATGMNFYINDNSTSGDVYTLAPGSDINTGMTPSQPKASLQALFDAYDLEGGDTVWVDAGYYQLSQDLIIGWQDSGHSGSQMQVAGSPDHQTIFDRGNSTNETTCGLVFNNSTHVTISNIAIQNADSGVNFLNADSCMFSDSLIRDVKDHGVYFYQAHSNLLLRTIIARSDNIGVCSDQSSYNYLEGCVVWDSGTHAISGSQSILAVSNSVLHASGIGNLCYQNITNSVIVADYNNLFVENGAFYGIGPSPDALIGEEMPQWVFYTTQDVHSLAFNPMFADPDNDDYHPMSPAGRYVVGMGFVINSLDTLSPLIDAGNPDIGVDNEPMPNGGRVNIGAYGNTIQASKSTAGGWMLEIYAANGTIIGATNGLYPPNYVFDLMGFGDNGYAFDFWSLDGMNVGSAPILTVTSDSPHVVTGYFATSTWDLNATGIATLVSYEHTPDYPSYQVIFDVCNPSDSAEVYRDKYVLSINRTLRGRLRYPDGISPCGDDYVDVTADVVGKLVGEGNGDGFLDPGECIQLDEVEVYIESRSGVDPVSVAKFYSKSLPDTSGTDTDSDGIPNGWEDTHGLGRNDPADAALDQDADGVTAKDEYTADTNPQDSNSYLHVVSILQSQTNQRILWIGGTSVVQYLEWTPIMLDGWQRLYTNTQPTLITNVFDYIPGEQGYYRVRTVR